MKKTFKLLIYLLSFLMNVELYAQITPTPVTVANGVVTLKGTGKIGGLKDAAQLRRYKKNYMTGDFFLQAYFRSLTNSNQSFTGIAFRNEGTTVKTDGGIPMVMIIYDNDTLKCLTKLTANTKLQTVIATPNIKAPGYLKLERSGNDLKYYYSTDAESATTVNYTLVATVQNVFTNWSNITQNFITGSATGVVQTAVISKIGSGVSTPPTTLSCNNGGTFDIISITQSSGNIYDINYNANNLSSVNIDIKNAAGVSVKNFNQTITVRPFPIDIGTQVPGTYTLTFVGQSCTGTTSKTFVVPTVTAPAPTLSSTPTAPVEGDNISLTASGCTSYKFYKNSSLLSVGTTGIISISSVVANDIYYVTCGNSTTPSGTVVIGSTPTNNGGQTDVSKVYHQGGKKIYNADGTVNSIPINPVITNDYFFSETVNRGCSQGTLMYAFDEGDYNGSNTRGWKNYPVSNIDLSAMQGKTLLFMSACVGSNYTDVFDTQSTFIYLKRNPNAASRNSVQITYVPYANNFVPNFSSNLPSVFTGTIPTFSIPQKHNIYEGTMPAVSVGVDLRNYGIKAWHLKRSAVSSFPSSANYITDNDNWANATGFRPSSSSPSANTTTFADMQNKANAFSGYGNLGVLLSDDEWRWGQNYDGTGLANMYAFYERTKANLPNTLLGAHHNSPYRYSKNTQSEQDDQNCFNGYFANERALYNALGGGFLGQYWADVPNKASGDNTGNTLFNVIPFDAYVHYYNHTYEIYRFAQTALVNKKFYPTKKVLTSIEGWLELLGEFGGNSYERYSWKTGTNSAETLHDFVPVSASHFENVALISNITGDGVNVWGNFLTTQDNRPNAYYANNSLVGTPSGYVNQTLCDQYGTYENTYRGHIDYLFLGLQKFSQIPQSYDFNNPIMYEISTDNGATWINNYNNVPGVLGRNQKPMAIGVKNSIGKHAIVAVHPYNSPIAPYTFKIRSADMAAIDVTVDGHFPSLILNNNSAQ